jgi:hypothetical protein
VSFLPRPDPGTRWTQVARKFDSLLEVMQQRSTAVRTTPQSTFKLPVNRRRWTHLKKGTKKTLLGAQRAGVDVDSSGAVMGTSAPQMRGAVLGRLKAEFSLVAMKAGCLRAFEALRGGGAAAVPPASAAAVDAPSRGPVEQLRDTRCRSVK